MQRREKPVGNEDDEDDGPGDGGRVDGRTPIPAPMLRHMPARVVTFGKGFVEMSAQVDPEVAYNDIGIAHGGWAPTLLDTAMGLAAMTLLPDGATCPSTDLSVRFSKPVRAEDGEVKIVGRVVSPGRRLIAAEGRVEGLDGRIHVLGNAAFMPVDRHDYAARINASVRSTHGCKDDK